MIYEFTQNNSGGIFVIDDKLCHRLFIEARNEEKAKEIAIRMGVYFDGVADGGDCPCCGDRWSSAYEVPIPYRYGTMTKAEAEKVADRYNSDIGKTTFRFMGTEDQDPTRYDAIFKDIESYAQYLADSFAPEKDKVDARIFYSDGRTVEIKQKKYD